MSASAAATRNTTTNNNNKTTTEEDSWSLSVKAVGSALINTNDDCNNNNGETSSSLMSPGEKNFTVTVSPEDTLASLFNQIEDVTGLKASQQRLIFRGRLIDNHSTASSSSSNNSSSNNSDSTPRGELKDDAVEDVVESGGGAAKEEEEKVAKIKDIVGLGDGQTIHLIKRQEPREPPRDNNSSGNASVGSRGTSGPEESMSGTGTASLLAALMGLGGLDDPGESNSEATAATPRTTPGRQRVGWRSSRMGRGRRPHYRLTAEDLQTSDPGTLEPVRQGLMTLHTLLPHASAQSTRSQESPLNANRQWFRGQWIDVRDTVNQWLEATVVEIHSPDEILPPKENPDGQEDDDSLEPILEPHVDPAVSAGDLEGRRRLLLEPCDVGDAGDEGGSLAGFRRRRTNSGVKILLIHYNGWPHRWDEWIRSDSERIRPFRTRTRHPNMATHQSPTTQSTFNEAPSTHIVDEDNGIERPAILPELSRAVSAINELLAAVAAEEAAQLSVERQADLPWAVQANAAAGGETGGNENDSEEEIDDELDALPPLSSDEIRDHDNVPIDGDISFSTAATSHSSTQPRIRSRQLQMLAPLLDRLGRTLVDAAPHVAALANASSDNDTEESISTAEAVIPSEQAEEHNPSTLGGLLSLLSRDRRRSSNNNNNNPQGGNVDEPSSPPQEHLTWPVDPDYVDFATGSVNTTRGEVRSGPRSRSSNDDVAGLLGAYLAAASLGGGGGGGVVGGESVGNDDAGNVLGLGRLLRERGGGGGNGGGGIDIHIHAVVTAPGMPPTTLGGGGTGGGGGLGFATLGAPPALAGAAARNSLSPSRDRRGSGGHSLLRLRTPTVVEEEDDLGLFSDLYSESPDPVNHNATPEDRAANISRREESASTSDNDFLARLSQPARRTSGSGTGSAHRDPARSTPRSRTSSEASSSRRSSTGGSSPRRGSVLGRLFRRSRRSSSGNNGP